MGRGTWWATVHGVTKSQTQLSDWNKKTRGAFAHKSFPTQTTCHPGLDSLGTHLSFHFVIPVDSRDSDWNARYRTLIWTWQNREFPACLHLLEISSSMWNQGLQIKVAWKRPEITSLSCVQRWWDVPVFLVMGGCFASLSQIHTVWGIQPSHLQSAGNKGEQRREFPFL